MLKPSTNLNLAIMCIGALYCFCPLYILDYNQIDAGNRTMFSLMDGNLGCWAPFFIIIIPVVDIILDLPAHVLSFLYRDASAPRKNIDSPVVIRLSDIERFLFILGMAAQSAICLLPFNSDVAKVGSLYHCSTNFSLLLLMGPIVVFLGRCTTTFTPNRVFAIVLLQNIGICILTTSYYYSPGSILQRRLALTGLSIATTSASIYFLLVLACFICHCMTEVRLSIPRQYFTRHFFTLLRRGRVNSSDPERVASDLYAEYTPALHMFASLIFLFCSQQITPLNYSVTFFVGLAAETMVLIIELRIRKKEANRGLVSLLARSLNAKHA